MSKLNRLVAERVMGYKWYQVSPNWYELGAPAYMSERYKEGEPTHGVWTNYDGPMFDTNISDAWEVCLQIQKLNKGDAFADAYGYANLNDAHRYTLGRIDSEDIFTAMMATPKERCIAALRAVGVPDAEIQEAMR